MHDDRAQVEARLRRAARRVRAGIVAASVPCAASALPPGDAVALEQVAARTEEFRSVTVGEPWGPPWTTTWFQLSGKLPASWTGRPVELEIDLGFEERAPGFQAEGLVYDVDGKPLKGIHPRNARIPVALVTLAPPDRAGADRAGADRAGADRAGDDGGAGVDTGEFRCFVEAVAMPAVMGTSDAAEHFEPTQLGSRSTAGSEPIYRFAGARLVLIDEEVRALSHDISVLAALMSELPLDVPRRHQILRGLERAVDMIDQAGVAPGAKSARAELAELLGAPAEQSAHLVSAVGHAHIDSAWLWPVSETVRKCARTFSSVLRLIETDPDLVFACSQAQQWDWMRERYPLIFEGMIESARSGRFLPVGGMWVESDTNVPGGESLARQLIYGKRFFLEHTGIECEEVWLPDCFGYSAALPQLIALSGARWFLTQKLSWNDTNRFPHHSFFWEGIDGTRIFTHFPPVDTYNAELRPAELARARRRFAEHGRARTSLVPFGYGDGGGGPTPEMLERGRRQQNLEGSPRVSFQSPAAFFRAAEEDYPDAPVWSGELYLEKHRGTLVSQARIKRGNRRCEHLLREAELWCTTSWRAGLSEYPYDALERLWKTLLLQQFHDILPGSSIADVNDQAVAALAATEAELESLIASATSVLAGPGDETLAFNGGPFGVAGVPALASGRPVPPVGEAASCRRDDGGRFVLSNGLIEVVLGEEGVIESLIDRVAGRQLLPVGQRADVLQLHPDYPARWDAWDIEAWYRHDHDDLLALDELSVVSAGPDEAEVSVERSFGASRVTQRLRLRRGERRLRIETDVDWHEHERLLKLAFPFDLHADSTSAEIQFGHLREPLARNTSWEAARFEKRCHRFVHLAEAGEPGYGVAVVNDSLYGYDVGREPRPGGGLVTTLRCSLVRGPCFPDPRGDAGTHRFVIELWPGATLFEAVRAGYACNLPLRLVRGGGVAPPIVAVEAVDGAEGAPGGDTAPASRSAGPSAVTGEGAAAAARDGHAGTRSVPGIAVESVKAAEDRSEDVIVRCYEALGGRARARLRIGFPLAGARLVDLLERPMAEMSLDSTGRVPIELRPFQVVTLRLSPRRARRNGATRR